MTATDSHTNLDRIRSMSADELAPLLVGHCIRMDARRGKTLAFTSPADDFSVAYATMSEATQRTVNWLRAEVEE